MERITTITATTQIHRFDRPERSTGVIQSPQ